jgi:hypothetical protein
MIRNSFLLLLLFYFIFFDNLKTSLAVSFLFLFVETDKNRNARAKKSMLMRLGNNHSSIYSCKIRDRHTYTYIFSTAADSDVPDFREIWWAPTWSFGIVLHRRDRNGTDALFGYDSIVLGWSNSSPSMCRWSSQTARVDSTPISSYRVVVVLFSTGRPVSISSLIFLVHFVCAALLSQRNKNTTANKDCLLGWWAVQSIEYLNYIIQELCTSTM